MLTPEYLARCTDRLLGLYDELDRALVADIARRIVKVGLVTPTVARQIDALQQVGMMTNEITQQVATVSRLAEDEVRQLFEESAEVGVHNDVLPLLLNGQQFDRSLTPAMRQVLQAAINKTNGDLRNLTMTTGVTASGKYLQAVTNASMKVQSGAFSYNQAICDAVREAAADGNTVSYSSGHQSKLDVAVRRSVLTGISQTAGKLTEINAEALGAEYYEVSAHAGARPTHAAWQGRVFKINGATEEYPNFAESTGYGTVDGLCGVNCRHSFYPFFPGISQPAYTAEELAKLNEPRYTVNGKKLTEYEVTQLMRKSEREIRETKRKIIGYQAAMEATDDPQLKAELRMKYEDSSYRLQRQQSEYNSLCKNTNHKPDFARTGVDAVKDGNGRIVSWNREVSKESVKGAESSYRRSIAGTGADIGGPKTLENRIKLWHNNKQENALYDQYLRQVKKGTISPLSTYANYKEQYDAIQRTAIGITTANGITISSQSKHFIERVIGTMEDPATGRPRSGVSVPNILDALQHPLEVGDVVTSPSGKKSQKFIGAYGTVSINPETGQLIQCNPTKAELRERLMKDGKQ